MNFRLTSCFVLSWVVFLVSGTPSAIAQCNTGKHDALLSSSWLSCNTAPNPKNPANNNHWIVIDLGDVYELNDLYLWNYNESGQTQNGIQHYQIDLSLELAGWQYAGEFLMGQASGTSGYSGESGPDLSGQPARYILITAIDNYGGSCLGISEIKVYVTDNPACSAMDFLAKSYPNTCPVAENGKIELTPEGGQAPYNYQWNTGAKEPIIENLPAGHYQVTVTDADGCQEALDIEVSLLVTEPASYGLLPVPDGAYYDDQIIESSGLIAFNGNVGFYSTIGIELVPGFEIVPGGIFKADIRDCVAGPGPAVGHHVSSSSAGNIEYYLDYIGAGHVSGVDAWASHETAGSKALYAIGGQGLLPDEAGASRFLAQATFGADMEMIQQLSEMGTNAWVEWQLSVPRQNLEDAFDEVINEVWEDQGNGLTEFPYFRMAWWQNIMTGEDYLRDRVAFALSEIFVVSSLSDLKNFGEGLTSYYDMLHEHALGNFRDLLFNVTLHPSMGLYLSHLNNPKSDSLTNQYPDENYAREAMQLFTIGLTILNSDGSPLKDPYGADMATYTNEDILEFSKIYTGLGFDAPMAKFGSRRFYDFTVPMIMYEDFHEPGQKNLFNGFVVPDGQTGMEDINDAVDNLFNHPNVGPFIGRRLIQHLVKSNPSPEYISRVSAAFEDNGSGERGDLGAVVSAVLLDPEARDCEWLDEEGQGKLREPIVRYAQFLRAFNASTASGTYYTAGNAFYELTFQAPLGASSVFNFYLPDYVPPGPAGEQGLYGPEFQILNSYTAIGYFNINNYLKENNNVMQTVVDPVQVDFSDEMALALNTEELLDRLDLLLTHSTMSASARSTITAAIEGLPMSPADRLKMAIYLVFITPEYVILK